MYTSMPALTSGLNASNDMNFLFAKASVRRFVQPDSASKSPLRRLSDRSSCACATWHDASTREPFIAAGEHKAKESIDLVPSEPQTWTVHA